MLEAIYAWRRNGGMRWPRYERSDAIMDLRAASRTSNSFNIALTRPLLILPHLRTIALSFLDRWHHRALSVPPLHPLCPPCDPSSQARISVHSNPHLVSTTERPLNRSPFARKKRVLYHYLVRCTLQRSPSPARREDTSFMHALSIFPAGRLTGTPLAASRRRPTGFCLQQVSCFGWLVGNVQKINHTKQGDYALVLFRSTSTYLWPSPARNPTTNTMSDAIDANKSGMPCILGRWASWVASDWVEISLFETMRDGAHQT
ncbi:hypothetical protein F5888DRAFT_130921 [Russula emetica]|nr:hypothetical protein F5888DRAFT_130921 [Russula emetica]